MGTLVIHWLLPLSSSHTLAFTSKLEVHLPVNKHFLLDLIIILLAAIATAANLKMNGQMGVFIFIFCYLVGFVVPCCGIHFIFITTSVTRQTMIIAHGVQSRRYRSRFDCFKQHGLFLLLFYCPFELATCSSSLTAVRGGNRTMVNQE